MTDVRRRRADRSAGPSARTPASATSLARDASRGAPAAVTAASRSSASLPHGTTVLGLKFAGGVVFAGDRRATEGYSIADDKMEKVFAADDYSVIAIAGAAGQAIEIVKLFQLELEHYEKITGDRLSLEGKANRLGQMIRGNFPLAMQGLVVVPLFGGFDERRRRGPALLLRRHRRTVGGGRLPRDRLRRPAGEELAEEAVAAGPGPRRGASASRSRRSSTPRRRTWPPVARTPRAASTRRSSMVTASGAQSVADGRGRRAAYEAVVAERWTSGGPRELHAVRARPSR